VTTIYLDNNATTRVAPEVFEAMLPYLTEYYGNPSSMHRIGARAATALKDARERVARFLHCREAEIIFTSCGTESNNTAIRGVLAAAPDKRHIVTTTVEHPSVLELTQRLEREGYEVTYVPVDESGLLVIDALRDALRDDTAIVSTMYANNETGVIFQMDEIVDAVKSRGIPLHVDAVQAAGKIPLDLSRMEIDLLSLSGHKVHAPKGVGLLYVRRATRLHPLLIGGGQEKGRRSGTENVAGIVGLGKALELADEYLEHRVDETRRLRNKLETGILSAIPSAVRNGTPRMRVPNTSSINFENVEGEAILLLLDEMGICASSGSACTTGAVEPSHVLKAMKVPPALAHGSIRFSLSRYTTEEEIDFVLEKLPPIVQRLGKLSAAG
jgi:cysteine desulfurase